MGDRANILIGGVDDGEFRGVYLYTHWSGTELPLTLQTALKKQWRWDDEQYLARVVFCEMVKGNEMTETGYGISAVVGAGAGRVLKVDATAQTVMHMRSGRTWTFDEYCNLSEDELFAVWDSQDVQP